MSDNGNKKGAIPPFAWLIIAVFIGIGGYILGNYMGGAPEKAEKPKPTKKEKAKEARKDKPERKPGADDKDIFNISVGESPVKGSQDALITIIECSEFQCPFCSRVNPTIEQIFKEYPGKVRVAFKHFPLQFHQQAVPAAKASIAAMRQGKFWEYHDILFENMRQLASEKYPEWAKQLGLDVEKFKRDMEDPAVQKMIDEDQKLCQSRGVRGTPGLFVNGRFVRGAQPFEAFKKIIDEELPKAEALAAKMGVKGDKLYNELVKDGKTSPPPPPPPPPEKAAPAEWVAVETGKNAPRLGPEHALVTIVEFSDFECGFCGRAAKTVHQIKDHYKDKVRVFFKQMPLGFHKNAHLAAQAALAAHEQGKFWEYHDKLFDNNRALQRDNLISYAKEIGLNVDKFTKALDEGKFKAAVDEDMAYAAKLGVRGTPHFFINGKRFSGAQPFERFQTEIDAAIEKAQAELNKGIKLDKLYESLMANLPKEAPAPKPAERPQEDPNKVHDVKVGAAPTKGPSSAPITIIEFSEFECPFCSKVNPTIEKVMQEYKGKVRFAFKHNPLAFHKNAMAASLAAMAAHEQGKFWEYHDKLFANQRKLTPPDLENYAKELGLDMAKWKKAFESEKYKAHIEADMKEAATVGARGTPTLFVNGRKIVGAQPFENFKKIIDEELAKIGKK